MGPVKVELVRQRTHDRFAVADEADAGPVRRAVAGYADQIQAGSAGRGRAELVATELATNVARHGRPGGWVLARPLPPSGIELLAVDRGPGIRDVAAAVAGRTPDPGGLGCGLAAVRRASSYFDIYTSPGRGTVVLSVVDLSGGDPSGAAPRTWGGVSVAVAGVCGDGWAVVDRPDGPAVTVVDGLGHGPNASLAADAALAAFAADPTDLWGLLNRANEAMRGTRGGALTACRLCSEDRQLWYLSVGNVSGRIVAPGSDQGLVSVGGTLGAQANPPRARVRSGPWPPGATLVVWTDGLASRLVIPDDLLTHDPAVIAATLHRDHARQRDDATVVVVRAPDR
jgi:anti-sigma regulatory factor (Ser/Thr protein kinase)